MADAEFKVKRSDDGRTFRWQSYRVGLPRKGMTVLDGLFWLVDSVEDPPAFRYTCRSAVCGSCAMRINGRNRLACKVQIASLSSPIVLEPLGGFEVIRDLVIDMGPFFQKYEKVHPYLTTTSEPPEREYVQTIEQHKQIEEATTCVMCSACTSTCPSYLSDSRFLGPAALLKDFRFLADSRSTERKPHLEPAGSQHGAWDCFTCKNCDEVCPKTIGLVDRFVDLRGELMMEGLVEKKLPDILQNLTRYGNSFGLSDRQRGGWTEGLGFKVKDARTEPVEHLWFVGDYASFDPRAAEVTRKVARVLNSAGLDFGIMYDAERNAGNEVRRMGEQGLFETLAERNVKAMAACRYDSIITTDPHTYNALKNDYAGLPGYEKGRPVLHYAEVLARLVDDGALKLRKGFPGRTTYHDPCYLGRFNDVYDAPRKVLESVTAEFVEMPRSRSDSYCCGAGGGRIWMEDVPGAGERPSENRIREALELGARTFVVACPKDYVMFQDAVKTLGAEKRIVVRDIAEILFTSSATFEPGMTE